MKAKIATDFTVFHAVISKAVNMRKKQHLVAYETAIIWKKKIVLAIENINFIILSQLQKVIFTEAMKNQCKVPWLT